MIKQFRLTIAVLIVLSVLLPSAVGAAQKAAPVSKELTGQHRGYTNDELYVRTDDGKETTFLVRIPGDTDWKWHKQFETLSRITVTYHKEAGEKRPIATAIKSAQ